jgi:hypothetical protein
VWLTAAVRGRDNPAFCKEGSDHPSAKLFPLKESSRQLAILDPKKLSPNPLCNPLCTMYTAVHGSVCEARW